MKIFFKNLINKRMMSVIVLIFLLALLTISFASATNENSTFINNSNINNTEVDDDLIKINNYTEVRQIVDEYNLGTKYLVIEGVSPTAAKFNIKNPEDFKILATKLNKNPDDYNIIIVSIEKEVTYNIDYWFNKELFHPKCEVLIIKGNNAIIKQTSHGTEEISHFLNIDKNVQVFMSNLNISGFNVAIKNNGIFNFNNCNFINNKIGIGSEGSTGGAIQNYGTGVITNSRFINNSAYIGGAIFTSENSILTTINCSYFNNYCNVLFNKMNDVCIENSIDVYNYSDFSYNMETKLDKEKLKNQQEIDSIDWRAKYSVDIKKYNNPRVYYVKDICTLREATKAIFEAEKNNIDLILVIFEENKTYRFSPWFDVNLFHPTCRKLIIEGNNALVEVKPGWFEDYNFLRVDNFKNVQIYNLIIKGFKNAFSVSYLGDYEKHNVYTK